MYPALVALIVPIIIQADPSGRAGRQMDPAYDPEATVMIRGQVAEVTWSNPVIVLLTEAETGRQWRLQGWTPNSMLRNGLSRDMMARRPHVVVWGFQSRDRRCDPACRLLARDIILVGSMRGSSPPIGQEK